MADLQQVGVDKPVVEKRVWIHIFQAELEDGDHLRIDEQEYDPEEV